MKHPANKIKKYKDNKVVPDWDDIELWVEKGVVEEIEVLSIEGKKFNGSIGSFSVRTGVLEGLGFGTNSSQTKYAKIKFKKTGDSDA